MGAIGKKIWAIAEDYLPGESEDRALAHEAICMLNTGDADAGVTPPT